MTSNRSYVIVSGYYGFDNLGDEAILEEICNELKELVGAENIFVLSFNPKATAKKYGVQAIERMDFFKFFRLGLKARLLLSGGGGLFQNTHSLGSIIFYGLQIWLAKLVGARVLIYAQGIGPLRGMIAQHLCKQIFSLSDAITVRDKASEQLLSLWKLQGVCTADPVWNLQPVACSKTVDNSFLVETQASRFKATGKKLIGLSLRPSPNLSHQHLDYLVKKLSTFVDPEFHLVLVPLQSKQDLPVLQQFAVKWQAIGQECTLIDPELFSLPSQWLSLFELFHLFIGMRLHALIMALKVPVPVLGIAYDPKITHLLTEFEQPTLILTKESWREEWSQSFHLFVSSRENLLIKARYHLELAKNLSCQNNLVLTKLLNQSDDG